MVTGALPGSAPVAISGQARDGRGVRALCDVESATGRGARFARVLKFGNGPGHVDGRRAHGLGLVSRARTGTMTFRRLDPTSIWISEVQPPERQRCPRVSPQHDISCVTGHPGPLVAPLRERDASPSPFVWPVHVSGNWPATRARARAAPRRPGATVESSVQTSTAQRAPTRVPLTKFEDSAGWTGVIL